MALKGFEKLNTILKKANETKKVSKVKSRNILLRIQEAEELAIQKLGKFSSVYQCLLRPEQVEDYLNSNLPPNSSIALDCETDGLDFYKNKVIGFSLTKPDKKSVYIPINHTDKITGERLINQSTPEQIKQIFDKFLLNRPDIKFDFHNGDFDVRMFIHSLNINLINRFGWDTMLVEHCLAEEGSHKLKVIHKQYYPEQYTGDDFEVIEFMDLFKDVPFANIKPEIAMLYAAGDTLKTLEVKESQIKYLSQPGNEKFFKEIIDIELGCMPATIRMEERGMRIDQKLLQDIDEKYNKLIPEYMNNCLKELEKFEDKIQAFRVKNPRKKLDNPINLGSASQMNTLLYDILKIKIEKPKKTAKASNEEKKSTDKKSLIKIAKTYPEYANFLMTLLKYRNATKMKSTYIDAIKDRIRSDGRIHGDFLPYGTVTGRYSSQDPNLQNIPKDPTWFRNFFIPSDGFAYGGGDYSKQEVFLTAEECQDPALIQVFKENKDIYSVLASTIYNVPYRECLEFETNEDGSWKLNDKGERISYHEGKLRRTTGKTGWLGLTYGLGPAGLMARANEDKQNELDEKMEKGEEITEEDKKLITLDEAKHILDQIKKGFPVAFKWIDETHKFVHKEGYVENMYGRRRHLDNILLPKYSIRLKKNFATDMYELPTYLQGDPLDFDNITVIDSNPEEWLSKIPESVYQPYITALNNAKYFNQVKQIKDKLLEEENLDVRDNGDLIAQAERQAVNSKIQGDAGCLIKKVLINIDKNELLNNYGCGLVNTIHDEIIVEINKEHLDECMNELNKVMVETAQDYVKSVKVKSDLTATECWYGEFIGKELSWTKNG